MFLESITARENLFLKRIEELKQTGGGMSLHIWGTAAGGTNVKEYLERHDISYEGMVVNRKYYDASKQGVLCMEDLIDNSDTKIALVVAFNGYNERIMQQYENKIEILHYDCFQGMERELDYEWVKKNEDRLQRTYDWCMDELSRDSLTAFLNQKISWEFGYLSKVKRECQYFEEGLVYFSQDEIFVDCGAYDGDSAMAFIKALRKQGLNSYKEIISFEPDSKNYKKLCERGLPNHVCIEKGCSDHSGKVQISGEGTSANINDVGKKGDYVLVETIDNVVGNKDVTMIKMDIEGGELAALRGAEKTIRRCHPKLAICIYHKKEDLYEIPEYIKILSDDYKLYVRAYEDNATELVLYAL